MTERRARTRRDRPGNDSDSGDAEGVGWRRPRDPGEDASADSVTRPDSGRCRRVNTEAVNDDVARRRPPAPRRRRGRTRRVLTRHPARRGVTGGVAGAPHPDTVLAAERLGDLQRLQAEYVNYKRRVDRDRALVQERAVRDVLESVLPVLDDIQAARDHGDLVEGPFAAIADKLEATLAKYGLQRFGSQGRAVRPDAARGPDARTVARGRRRPAGRRTATTVVTVLQPGYRAGEQVLRPARVAVADPA